MKIYEKHNIIDSICYVSSVKSNNNTYYTTNRQTDAFVYVTSGSVIYSDSAKSFTANKGDIIYLSFGSSYKVDIQNNDYSFIVVDFLFKHSSNNINENELFKFSDAYDFENLFIKLNKYWPLGTVESKLSSLSILYEIYSKICKYTSREYLPNQSKIIINIIIDYIIKNCFSSKININKILCDYNISEAHFRRLFKKIYGISPIKFIQNMRINKAKQMLINESSLISEIAKSCGYEDEYYFSRIFKKTTGLTPSEYRASSLKHYK